MPKIQQQSPLENSVEKLKVASRQLLAGETQNAQDQDRKEKMKLYFRARYERCHPNHRLKPNRTPNTPITKDFILKNVTIDPITSCWIWKMSKTGGGYGSIKENGRSVKTHRRAWELWVGPILDGLWVLHDCPDGDNRACCNPAHLWLGTDLDNKRDAIKKGRFPIGENGPNSKLTSDQVREIRASAQKSSDLAVKYSVSPAAIHFARYKKTYKSVA